MLTCLLVGTVAGILTRSVHLPSLTGWLQGNSADTSQLDILSIFSRDELEGEVRRLNREIAEREKKIDELRIEMKLVRQGSSRSAR